MPLQPSKIQLRTYSGESLPVEGTMQVKVTYEGQAVVDMPILVVKGSGLSLLGRDWLSKIKLNWKTICNIRRSGEKEELALEVILDRHQAVSKEGLGTIKNFEAKIVVDADAKPVFSKARSVPYAYRSKVEKELERLTELGIIEPIESSDWAAPIVCVAKKDAKNSIRICGDFKCTVNRVSKLDRYPIPKIEDLFTKLAGGKKFTKLDMSQAYQQIPLSVKSK